MNANRMFHLQTDATQNLIRIRYTGQVTVAGMKACRTQVENELSALRPEFRVLTDLSGLESMDLDCVEHLTKIMDLFSAKGVGMVVRVIPDPSKDIGFKILSIIHLRRGVKIVTCDTLAEAERALKTSAK
jgi:anti-anti-sigma regulatory factor